MDSTEVAKIKVNGVDVTSQALNGSSSTLTGVTFPFTKLELVGEGGLQVLLLLVMSHVGVDPLYMHGNLASVVDLATICR